MLFNRNIFRIVLEDGVCVFLKLLDVLQLQSVLEIKS